MVNEINLLRNNIKKLRLLNESVDRNAIIDAIKGHKIVYIYYQGDNTVKRGYRTIEPYTLGTHKSTGNLLLRAYQQAGASDTKGTAKRERDEIPGWRLFNVEGISSFAPVLGNKSNFKSSVTPRKGYNPNDSALNVIATFEDDPIDTNTTKNLDSIEEPNFYSNDKSVFDKQTDAFKSFMSDSNKFPFKKTITDLFGRVKFSRKQNPKNYIVITNNRGDLIYKPKSWENRVDSEDIVGNLDDLFSDISGINNATKKQFEDYQNELNQKASVLGGSRKKPIDRFFLKNKYKEFEKTLENL